MLTPVGLRSLSRNHPDYKPAYDGDLRARDAAYHQGTVWGWLIGPFIDAWLKVHPSDVKTAMHFLDGFRAELGTLLHRHDQRSLRRRAAVHAARMRRASMERGGGAAGADRSRSALKKPLHPKGTKDTERLSLCPLCLWSRGFL